MEPELTSKQTAHAVIVSLVCPVVVAGFLLLSSWIAHTYGVTHAQAAVKGGHGTHAAPAQKGGDLSPQSPVFWAMVIPTFGLAALPPWIAALVGGILGLFYGIEAGLAASYTLDKPLHWFALLIDLTWSFGSTLLGLVFGNILYFIWGSLSRTKSTDETWISFDGSLPGGALQTLGTFNLGGRGMHEYVHLIQARILGPVYLPIQIVSYVLNTVLQLLWTGTLGLILKLAGARDSAWFRPDRDSAVKTADGKTSDAADFFGWIYRYSVMELWAYATQ
jgi:hypothetical protein